MATTFESLPSVTLGGRAIGWENGTKKTRRVGSRGVQVVQDIDECERCRECKEGAKPDHGGMPQLGPTGEDTYRDALAGTTRNPERSESATRRATQRRWQFGYSN